MLAFGAGDSGSNPLGANSERRPIRGGGRIPVSVDRSPLSAEARSEGAPMHPSGGVVPLDCSLESLALLEEAFGTEGPRSAAGLLRDQAVPGPGGQRRLQAVRRPGGSRSADPSSSGSARDCLDPKAL